MATNFTISTRRKNNKFYVDLKGDFDRSSAHLLLNALRKNSDFEGKIYVDTNGLRLVSPFSLEIMKRNLTELKNKSSNIIFIGKYGPTLSP